MPPKKQLKLLFGRSALLGSPYTSIIDLEILEAGSQDNTGSGPSGLPISPVRVPEPPVH